MNRFRFSFIKNRTKCTRNRLQDTLWSKNTENERQRKKIYSYTHNQKERSGKEQAKSDANTVQNARADEKLTQTALQCTLKYNALKCAII